MRLPPCLRATFFLLLCGHCAAAAEVQWQGRQVTDFIAWLIEQDIRIIYSNDLVGPELILEFEPDTQKSIAALRKALEANRLTLADGPDESFLVIRSLREAADADPSENKIADIESVAIDLPLTEIVVSSSLYSLEYDQAGSHTFLDRQLTTQLPDVTDDAVRAIHRLPGIASGGVSARSHVRGGIDNEQLFLFDGLRLYEPFHLKDFQALSSIVDQNAVDGVDFYSAGYQARYGDRMSGVIDMSMRQPEPGTITELALNFYSASVLSMGRFGGSDHGDWLITGRRGNLDLVADIVNPDYGSPSFEDSLLHVGWELGDKTYLSANALLSYDKVSLNEIDGSEQANATYRNRVAWLKAETDWTSDLSSSTILSATAIDNARLGSADIAGVLTGNVTDIRKFRNTSFRQDWRWTVSDALVVRSGLDLKHVDARYDYDSSLQIFSPFDQILNNQATRANNIQVAPSGGQYAAYFETRWRPFERLVLDGGIRWDQQTYTTAENDDQTSLRFNLLYFLNDRTEIRLGGGRYYQAQEINELQVADGVTSFFPAQRATHVVSSISHALSTGIDIHVEVYRKKYRSLMKYYENAFDPLVLIPELQIDRLGIDTDGAVAKGAELRISGESDSAELLWWLSYTWSSIKDEQLAGDVRRSWDQTNTINGGLSWDWNKWNFSASGVVHTGWPRTDLLVNSITNADGSTSLTASTSPRNRLRHSPFHTLDARASRRIDVSKGELTAFLEVSNLYDRQNPCCAKYRLITDGDGKQILSRNTGNWLPLIPSIGIIWQF